MLFFKKSNKYALHLRDKTYAMSVTGITSGLLSSLRAELPKTPAGNIKPKKKTRKEGVIAWLTLNPLAAFAVTLAVSWKPGPYRFLQNPGSHCDGCGFWDQDASLCGECNSKAKSQSN